MRLVNREQLIAASPAVLLVLYFTLPFDGLGPRRPTLSWTLFGLSLALIALLLIKHIRDIYLERTDATHPGIAIPALMFLSVLVFSTTYYSLADDPDALPGLDTRLDALYFTIVTLATVGYGDISPASQSARLIALLNIAYNLIFITAAATTLTHYYRGRIAARHGRPPPDD
ncbi:MULTISPECIES: potassium channel family protein [Streptomyces]|uniref:Potassium channel family protein n=1 Tax=Streptomyces chengmaiensis TaxID=3040919 RepID=A0ABT6HHL7_9ACTN|nr:MULTISPECIES: potassium channel family protein [Streptomyces]MDH2387775.1 potassium channel family protein [Streptomyces chengmaiensis]WRQ82229.1 potassium channel family protein [Streptomyces sp. MUM 178J]